MNRVNLYNPGEPYPPRSKIYMDSVPSHWVDVSDNMIGQTIPDGQIVITLIRQYNRKLRGFRRWIPQPLQELGDMLFI